MLCCHCNENQATKTYERKVLGTRKTEYYCLTCYQQLFLEKKEAEGEVGLSACPYCGLTVEEFEKTKLVGCAHCYQTLSFATLPSIIKMQGRQAHRGKSPSVEIGEESALTEDLDPVIRARFERQCRELTLMIEKLTRDGNYKDAKEYAAKLSRMKSNLALEEDFVWRGSTEELKKP